MVDEELSKELLSKLKDEILKVKCTTISKYIAAQFCVFDINRWLTYGT